MIHYDHKSRIAYLTINIMVMMLYIISGDIGLIFATGSQYSTAIWPPSGIALGSVLVFGPVTLPGIFFGSLFVNYHITIASNVTALGIKALFVGILIATGAVLQALSGWYIIKKWVGLHNTLNEPNDILLFAFLSGPVSCLVNASTSNITLFLLHILPAVSFLQSWITWYVGDNIGILIFAPIFLIIFAKPYELWHARIMPILIPLTVSFLIVASTYIFVKNNINFISNLWFVMVSGLLFCVLINIILFIIHGQKNLIELRMNEILRSSGEVILGVDMNEKIIFSNSTAEHLLGMNKNELLGMSIHNVILVKNGIHNDDCPIAAASQKNKTTLVSNKLLSRKNAPKIWVEYICTPFTISNKTIGTVIILNNITERIEYEFKLKKLAHYDPLTDLPNRFSFIETLTKSIKNIDKLYKNLTMCFLDLDNFKLVNDQMGHSTGDLVLKHIARIITESVTSSDYYARLGGDEFGIILYNRKDMSEINSIVEKLIDAINQPIYIGQSVIHISVSIGIASYPISGTTSEELIKNADIAMYRAKDFGKNTFAYFNSELNDVIKRIHLIESELQYAIMYNELALYYQPQVSLITKKITGFEVLLRWFNPVLGEVSPSEFIPIAEKNGMIHPIGAWIFKQLAKEYIENKTFFSNKLTISINVSVPQLSDNRFYNQLVEFLNTTQLIGYSRVILEITETAFIHKPKETIAMMQMISKLGVSFALDDFGMNYSSLHYLKNLPISQIKIDCLFVKSMTKNKNDFHIVKTILQLANGLGLPTVAEGVETHEQFHYLTIMKCTYAQGFYLYKAMPLVKLLECVAGE